MNRTLPDTVRELCLSLPGTDTKISHGAPHFRVANKGFAIFVLNHHGDRRVALWLASPPGVQRLYTEVNPEAYFVPPYVGPRGWLGVELDKGLSWAEIIARVREAYENIAPAALAAQLPDRIDIEAPNVAMTPQDINPMLGERPQKVLKKLEELCQRLPETTLHDEPGTPAWKAGKKTFLRAHHAEGRMKLHFWVGVEQQPLFEADKRFSIPMYWGSNGWIELDVQDHLNWAEIESLAENSYRHFALKRMLKAMGESI